MFFKEKELGSKKGKKGTTVQPIVRAVVSSFQRNIEFYTEEELIAARGEELIYDVEIYENYFLIAFMSVLTKKVIAFELSDYHSFDPKKLNWVMHNFKTKGFNSRSFDLPIVWLAICGHPIKSLKHVANQIINYGMRVSDIEEQYNVTIPKFNHVDIKEVAPLSASLKTYAGRLHAKRMQDLPYDPDSILTREQMIDVALYCVNDLDNTDLLCDELKPQSTLREQMGAEYDQDLRSLSDAQIAERLMKSEILKLTGKKITRPTIAPGTTFKYEVPDFVSFKTPQLQHVLEVVRNSTFVLGEIEQDEDDDDTPTIYKVGKVKLPQEIKDLDIRIGESVYKFGNGGLHSSEANCAQVADGDNIILDADVTSYYPWIILILKLFPKHIGEAFLKIYKRFVDTRLEAKKIAKGSDLTAAEKAQVTMDSIKIVINGLFGKLGSKWSSVFSPDLMIQVTVTGQLCLLMLIEMIELYGMKVISANTDGIVSKLPKQMEMIYNMLCWQWMQKTGFQLEFVEYSALYSQSVNSYIAVKKKGGTKGKSAFADHWDGNKRNIFKLHKNPQNIICVKAVHAFIEKGSDISHTIESCRDITQFVTVRNVRGGGFKGDRYLGKVVRWYYAKGEIGTINYIASGNKVPKSDGAKPCMDLPDEFPDDIDYDWYINEANDMLYDLGYYTKTKPTLF